MNTDYIALVRSKPCPTWLPGLLASLEDAGSRATPATVFFHGDGCETAHALAGGALGSADIGRFDLRVCATSWARRYGHASPPAPLRVESLVFLFQRLALARRVDSFGLGGWYCCRALEAPAADGAASRLLLEVASAPADHRQRRETLEVALGAAALELEARVLFHGPGLDHLAGEGARGWRQITDFGLLEILAQNGGGRIAPDRGVVGVDFCRVVRLRAAAATILLL